MKNRWFIRAEWRIYPGYAEGGILEDYKQVAISAGVYTDALEAAAQAFMSSFDYQDEYCAIMSAAVGGFPPAKGSYEDWSKWVKNTAGK